MKAANAVIVEDVTVEDVTAIEVREKVAVGPAPLHLPRLKLPSRPSWPTKLATSAPVGRRCQRVMVGAVVALVLVVVKY